MDFHWSTSHDRTRHTQAIIGNIWNFLTCFFDSKWKLHIVSSSRIVRFINLYSYLYSVNAILCIFHHPLSYKLDWKHLWLICFFIDIFQRCVFLKSNIDSTPSLDRTFILSKFYQNSHRYTYAPDPNLLLLVLRHMRIHSLSHSLT